MKELQLSRGYVATVDDSDWEWLSVFRWHARVRTLGGTLDVRARRMERGKTIYLHREIMKDELTRAETKAFVDHINGDPLDNRRSNLRICDSHGNARNMRYSPNIKRGLFKGVYQMTGTHRFAAHITGPDGKQRYLGSFDTPEQAARAYDQAAVDVWGEFAATNFPVAS